MKAFVYYIYITFFVISALQAQSTNIIKTKQLFDWASIPLSARAEIVSAIWFDSVSFQDQTLPECLEKLRDMTQEIVGKSFSITTINYSNNDQKQRFTMKLKDVTLHEVLKNLATASGSSIEMDTSGCVVTYGKKE